MKAATMIDSATLMKLRKPSIGGTTVFVLYGCFLYFFFGYVAYLLAASNLFILFKVIAIALCYFISLAGIRVLGNAGHDGTHFSLHKNKIVSSMLGCFCASSFIGFAEMGFAIVHWYHHRYTNTEQDPDVCHYRQFDKEKGLLKRLLMAFPSRLYTYFKYTVLMARGKDLPLDTHIGLSKKELKFLSRINLSFIATWILFYALVTYYNPLYGFIAFLLPNFIGLLANSFTVFVQHGGTSSGKLSNSRSITSLFATILYFGGNFHLEHHLYPGVPMYRLPRLHRILKENKVFQNEEVYLDAGASPESKYMFMDYPNGRD